MSLQFDFQSGFDISGLTSVSKAQLMAMVNQIAPLSNIGEVIFMSGAAGAHPDVTNNPRFIRYIWLDIQDANNVLIKIYQGTYPSDTYADWSTLAIADNSITAAKIATYAVSILNGAGSSKIAYKQDGSADATKSNFLVRLDAAGQYVEVVNAATVIGAATLQPNKLDISTATDGMVLTYSSSVGTAIWKALSVTGLIAANSLTYDRLVNGTAGYILRANPLTGVIEAASNDDSSSSLFPVHTIGLNKLATPGTSGDAIRSDGTSWVKTTPFFGSLGTLPAADGIISIAHGLAATPRVLIGYVKNISGGALNGYNANDLISITSIGINSTNFVSFGISADVTNVYASVDVGGTGTGYMIRPKAGGPFGAIADVTNWQVWIYASL